MGDAERLNGKLEPEAKGVIESISGAALVSLAVSVKRIADHTAASADRIKELEAEVAELKGRLIPPDPVLDPDILAFREWAARRAPRGSTDWAAAYRRGRLDHTDKAQAYLAGARMVREQERKRALPLVRYIEDLGYAEHRAALLDEYRA